MQDQEEVSYQLSKMTVTFQEAIHREVDVYKCISVREKIQTKNWEKKGAEHWLADIAVSWDKKSYTSGRWFQGQCPIPKTAYERQLYFRLDLSSRIHGALGLRRLLHMPGSQTFPSGSMYEY